MAYKQGCACKYTDRDDAYFLQYKQDDSETNKQNLGMNKLIQLYEQMRRNDKLN